MALLWSGGGAHLRLALDQMQIPASCRSARPDGPCDGGRGCVRWALNTEWLDGKAKAGYGERSSLSSGLASGLREAPATPHPTHLLGADCRALSPGGGRQPRDVPTHGSPAAARQANARVRPRAAVVGPAHRPRPAQPSVPAPAGDLGPDSPAGTRTPVRTPASCCVWGQEPCPGVPNLSSSLNSGNFADINLITFPGWPSPSKVL